MQSISLISLVSIVSAVALTHLLLGVPHNGHDTTFHLGTLAWLEAEPWRGVLPPLWLHQPFGDLGGPVPAFYGTAGYLPALALLALGTDLDMALSFGLALSRVAAGLGVALWLRDQGYWPAAAGATFFVMFPFNFSVGPFIAFRYAEAMAFGLLPWLLLAADRPIGRAAPRILMIGLCFAWLAMTHLISTILMAMILPAWVFLRRGRHSALVVVAGGALGAMLAAWLLLPALTLRGLIHEGGWTVAQRMADTALFQSWPVQEAGGDWSMYALLHLSWLICVVLAIVALTSAPLAARFSVGLCLAMAPPLVWAWPLLPILVNVQFSWRLLGPLSLFASALTAALWLRKPRSRLALGTMLLVLLGQLAIPWADLLGLPSYMAPRFAADRAATALQVVARERGAAEYLPASAIASAIDWEDIVVAREELFTVCAVRACAPSRVERGSLHIMLDGRPEGELVRHFFWPGMVCDGCEISAEPTTGLILARAAHPVEAIVRVVPLGPQRMGLLISALGLVLVAVLAVYLIWQVLQDWNVHSRLRDIRRSSVNGG